MTIPVSTEYTAGTTTNKYEMCFYIGAVHQDDPATPADQNVSLQDRPEMTVLTRSGLRGFGANEPSFETWTIM